MRLALLVVALAMGCAPDVFEEVHEFGDNPGGLRMFEHPGDGPLVVFLHGCSQNHDAARTAGLVKLADERGFHLVAPEQGSFNNAQACFNWFEECDTARDAGEAASIRSMVAHVDRAPVFVAGLSAGGAMTASLLAAYPDVFAAGAVVAGGPAGCAGNVAEAAGCMAGTTTHSAEEWADLVREATDDGDERTEWPRVLVMQGRDDAVVSPANADAVVAQWTALHGVEGATVETIPTSLAGEATHESFGPVERVLVDGLGHALPIDPTSGCGEDAPFQQDIDLCAVELVADFFGL